MNSSGAFASRSACDGPSAELLTFKAAAPFDGIEPPTRDANGKVTFDRKRIAEPHEQTGRGGGDEDYVSILGQRGDVDTWACLERPGLVLRFPPIPFHIKHEEYLVFSTTEADFERVTLEGGGYGRG